MKILINLLQYFLKATSERERSDRANFEKQMREKTREIADLQQK
jgi:hypothetical protein